MKAEPEQAPYSRSSRAKSRGVGTHSSRAPPGCARGERILSCSQALAAAARAFVTVSDTPRLDAELLMAHAFGIERDALLLGDQERPAPEAFDALVQRRLTHEPIAYITGRRAFWTVELEVGSGVLVPRPDSETLIEAALANFGAQGPKRILDLGTGPGTLLLAALAQWPEASGLGVDSSEAALRYARSNIRRLGLVSRAQAAPGDWLSGAGGAYDLVLCNPPYIAQGEELPPDVARFEPSEALFGGCDGLDHYRMLAPLLADKLAPGGIVCLEIGAGQDDAVTSLMVAAGFTVASRADLAGIVRCLILRP